MSKALEAAVKAASAAILSEAGHAMRLDPIPRSLVLEGEEAEWLICDRENFAIDPKVVARAIILAFLDAAASRQGTCWIVAEAVNDVWVPAPGTNTIIMDDVGKAAILALKEAVG